MALSTDLSISSDARDGSPDVVFWRSVATQRARELDGIKDEIKKVIPSLGFYCLRPFVLNKELI